MKHLKFTTILFALCLCPISIALSAEQQTTEPDLIDLEELTASPLENNEELESEINIIRRKDGTITEYRINGRLYKAKITPIKGPPYYLVDRDGDGNLESRVNDIYQDIPVPSWVLLSW